MSRVVLNLGVSIDGFIARRDGTVDWLFPFNADYGMKAFWKGCGAAIMGARTYQDVLKFDGGPYPRMENYVVTHKRLKREGFTFVSGSVRKIVRDIERTTPKDIWLVGGAALNGAFLDADLIDRMVVTCVPVVLGSGIPIFTGSRRQPRVKLEGTRSWKDGVVQLAYTVRR